jgi:putative membrane protein insertion efficiency factor
MGSWLRHRAVRLLLACALIVPVGLDLARPAPQQVSARCLIAGIHLYQATLSPRMSTIGIVCRFRPSCSHYAEGAIAKYGALSGSFRAVWRVARCGPWTPLGTVDPP